MENQTQDGSRGIPLSMMAVVKVFIRVSTALCRRQTRVSAVPISFDAPESTRKEKQIN
jgi:hypothetical protein